MLSEYTVNSPALEYLTRISALCNTFIFFVTLIYAAYQVHQTRITRHHSNLSQIFSRNSDLNKRTEDDKYRRKAAENFVPDLNINKEAKAKEGAKTVSSEEMEKLYWGVRSYLMDLITLILQVWLIADKPKKLSGDFTGWQIVAKSVSDEIRGLTYASKPDWYKRACDDILKYVNSGRVYPPQFIKWMEEISQERKKRKWVGIFSRNSAR